MNESAYCVPLAMVGVLGNLTNMIQAIQVLRLLLRIRISFIAGINKRTMDYFS